MHRGALSDDTRIGPQSRTSYVADLPDLIGAEAHRPAAVNSPTLNSWGRIGKVTSRGGSDYNHRPRHQLTVWQSNATRTCTVKGLPGKWRPLVFVAYQKAGLLGQVAWLGESRKAKPCGCSLTRSLAPFPQPRSTSRWRRRRGALPPAGLRLKRLISSRPPATSYSLWIPTTTFQSFPSWIIKGRFSLLRESR